MRKHEKGSDVDKSTLAFRQNHPKSETDGNSEWTQKRATNHKTICRCPSYRQQLAIIETIKANSNAY